MRPARYAVLAAFLPLAALATVNVNTAQQTELQRTKGLDKYKAKSLIEYRAQNGSIDNFNELAQVPGFTPDVIDKVKTQVAFNGDPFVPPPKATAEKKKKKG
jgi:competence ComEA-like helix-hairpin-helix protein